MELTVKEFGRQDVVNTGKEIKMKLSENASSFVFQMFTKNVYSNPIGTVVREITSNCFDSHIEAGVNAPVLIKKFVDKTSDTIYISFIDYGVGMSPNRVENIYGVYFESTKRLDNSQIGGFGIGAKSVLAYKRSTGAGEGEYDNSFYVITNFNGIRYMYCIYEGKESPVISLLHQENTSECNGTEVRIPVLEKDVNKFEQEMVRQLYYFENIIFEGFNNQELNEYKIIRGKSFWFRGSQYTNSMHICLGRVAYPIDYNVLGLSSNDYNIPVAVKLEVGDINVTVSRESLDYSEATIKFLKKKLEEVKQELIELLIKQYENIVSLEDYFKVKNKFGYLYLTPEKSLYLNNVIKQSDVDFGNFKYNFMKMPNDKQLFNFFFNIKRFGKKERRSRYDEGTVLGYDNLNKPNILYVDGDFQRKVIKQGYLNHTHGTFYIISKKVISKFMKYDIADLFRVQIEDVVDDKGNVLPFVQSLVDMQEEYMSIVRRECESYDTLEIPEDFIRFRKQKVTKDIEKITIPAKINDTRYTVLLKDLFEFNGTIFYGYADDAGRLVQSERLFELLFDNIATVEGYGNRYYHRNDYKVGSFRVSKDTKKAIMFIMIAKGNAKYMEYCRKAHHIDEFYDKMLKRKEQKVLDAFQSHEVINRYDKLNYLYKNTDFEQINQVWGDVIIKARVLYDKLTTNRCSRISNYKYELSRYFDLSNLKKTKTILTLEKHIEDLELLEQLNEKTLDYINISPYDKFNPTVVDILKKVMVF